jgi:hypothetical protein
MESLQNMIKLKTYETKIVKEIKGAGKWKTAGIIMTNKII